MAGRSGRRTGRDERPQAQAERELTDIARKGYEPGTSALPDQRPVPRYAEHREQRDSGRSGGEGPDPGTGEKGGQTLQEARRKGLLPDADAAGPPQDAPSEGVPSGGPGR